MNGAQPWNGLPAELPDTLLVGVIFFFLLVHVLVHLLDRR